MLRKCKSLSRQLGRSYSYSSLRSKSSRDHQISHDHIYGDDDDHQSETIFVGSTRKRYVVSSKYLNHPLLNALIEKSKQKKQINGDQYDYILVKCEVVLFDHLLWMLENADPNDLVFDSLEELADLYVF
ncbi:hypothetical protein Q3G72_026000 [Acer saccharum]|nr:hypothetical protein Q3G72_026000 [Acer saccharum]